MRRVTLKDIAAVTGFSVNTVSRALNDRPEINKETKAKIQEVAHQLGYRPNLLAQGLRRQRSNVLGVVVTDIANPFWGAVVKSIEQASRQAGYRIILLDTDENIDLELEASQTLISQRVDGVLICPVQHGTECMRELQKHGVPFVLVGRRFPDCDYSYVIPDDEQAGYLAAKHLIDLGHSRIGFINAPQHISSARERLRGFKAAHAEAGIEVSDLLIRFGALSSAEGQALADSLLKGSPQMSAAVAFSDFVAYGVLQAAIENGLSVPSDLSVVGIDDTKLSSWLPRPLTTVRSPKRELGVAAVEAIASLLNQDGDVASSAISRVLDMELVVRSTTSSPSSAG
jgi:LacI family transcriptional regulator